jgi:hypothetical protein
VRDYREASSKRNSGNLEIVRPDALPGALQGMANPGVVARSLIVERERNKRLQESLDDDALVDGIPAPLGAEQ